jgi:ribosomal protein S18 acetylase RimI-like enzyme
LVIVACLGHEIIGFACFHDVGFRAYLSEMAIAANYQKQGIGSKLLQKGKTLLAKRGCVLVVADVYPPAEDFYRKHGWISPKSTLLARDVED